MALIRPSDNAPSEHSVAIHEAGHSFMHRYVGFWVGNAGLGRSPDGRSSHGYSNHALQKPPSESDPGHIAACALAGFAAERRANPSASPAVSARSDFREAAIFLGHKTPFSKVDRKRDRAIQEMLKQIDRILRDEWPVVEAVADALVEKGMLPGPVLAELIRSESVKIGTVRPDAQVYVNEGTEFAVIVLVVDDGTPLVPPPIWIPTGKGFDPETFPDAPAE